MMGSEVLEKLSITVKTHAKIPKVLIGEEFGLPKALK